MGHARQKGQIALLCGCGGDVECRYCARRARLNREHFAGQRELVLRRDGCQCQLCGEPDPRNLVVHHRRPGHNRAKYLVTLCRACHVRVHFTLRPGFGFVSLPFRRTLWRELHPRMAEQRPLPIGEPERAEQIKFFEL